jgi:spermidine synthase
LRLLVFVAGGATMGTEMSASRLLAPSFGSSVIVWANLIGLILVYMSVGYWLGGRVADRYASPRTLSELAAAAAAAVAALPFVTHPLLAAAAAGIVNLSGGVVVGSFIASLALLSVPMTLLGMVPPFAVRLAMTDLERAGSTAGAVSSLSTIGSIAGTFGAALVGIPSIGTRRTLLAIAACLVLAALPGLRAGAPNALGPGAADARTGGERRRRLVARLRRIAPLAVLAAVAVLMALPTGLVRAAGPQRVVFEGESRYQFVQVTQTDSGVRQLLLDDGWAVHSEYDPTTPFTGGYWDDMALAPGLTASAAHAPASGRGASILVLGSAAGTLPRLLLHDDPSARVDGVELDPLVVKVGYRYFHMPHRHLAIHTADARPWLAATRRRFNLIYVDAYRQPSIPFYLCTREFFRIVRAHLRPGGVVEINLATPPDDRRVDNAVSGTMRSVFATVVRYRAEDYNTLTIASSEHLGTSDFTRRIEASYIAHIGNLQDALHTFLDGLRVVRPPHHDAVLTDDHAPVEWMTDLSILKYVTRPGGPG